MFSGDMTNSIFVGQVAQKIEDIISMQTKGDFSKVTAKSVPRCVVARNHKPTGGTEDVLEEAWSVVHKVEVAFLAYMAWVE